VLVTDIAMAQPVSDPFAALAGRWVWVGHRDKLGLQKACADHATTYEIPGDRRTIIYRSGREQKGGFYTVLYRDGNSIVMYLDGEDRKYKNGDRWVWVLQVENPTLFYWRIFTTTLEQSEGPKFARVKCP
jgi:hypothetical protein